MTKKICVVTGSRADYGLLRWLMAGIRDDPGMALQLIATGMHLSPEFGLTYREIEWDGFVIDRKVEMLLSSDTPSGVAKSIGLGVLLCSDALRDLAPDMLLLLGDRFEIFAAAIAATAARIPIAHLHGGETTEGAIDEAFRHAITKMSHLHFVAAEAYRRRVIQLGEAPQRVFTVGALGLDGILKQDLLDRDELESELGFDFGRRSLMVTFHPVTLEAGTAARQVGELLAALDALPDTRLIFTLPNADTDGRGVIDAITRFAEARPNASVFASLGQRLYLSCLRQVDGVVGNSSSGLIEAPSLRIGTVNIGDRQRGRIRAESVIDCAPERGSITEALHRLFSTAFQDSLKKVVNPYGDGGASDRVLQVIGGFQLEGIVKKTFFDFPGTAQFG